MGTWPLLEGAPPVTKPTGKSYDVNRRKMAHFVGMDFLFTQREYCQSIQTDCEGRRVLVNSSKRGEILAVRPVPDRFLEKPWFNRKLRFPRQYLGITKIDERINKLSYLVHILTQFGIPNRTVLKGVNRLSKIWYHIRFEDMRKHVKSLTREVSRAAGLTRSPWKTQKVLSTFPRFTGDIIHGNGIKAPLWSRSSPLAGKDKIC
jgi:hypothetical protein